MLRLKDEFKIIKSYLSQKAHPSISKIEYICKIKPTHTKS